MRCLTAIVLSVTVSLPAFAEGVISEASGNWAGASGQGFTFLARLTANEDKARLTIFSGNPGAPAVDDGDPEFDNPEFALSSFATMQRLEVLETGQGSILQVVTEYADEEGSGRAVTQMQFIDNQFTVVGYFHAGEYLGDAFSCEVDLWKMTSTEAGATRALEPVGFEALNASDWRYDAPYERGFCSRGE